MELCARIARLSEGRIIEGLDFLLVTNDFPPKVGGIQFYLYELFSRFTELNFKVITRDYKGASEFDAKQTFKVERLPVNVLGLMGSHKRLIASRALEESTKLIIYDPLFPTARFLPEIATKLRALSGIIIHGAEADIALSVPVLRRKLMKDIKSATFLISAGNFAISRVKSYFESDNDKLLIEKKTKIVPPGVDVEKFHPVSGEHKEFLREKYNFRKDAIIISSVSRLVPRKGFDVLIKAFSQLKSQFENLELVIIGSGRDLLRLKQIAKINRVKVTFVGSVEKSDLISYYQVSDIFAMFCRNQFFGLDQEGFGIVFLEAGACGLPQVGGKSGGSSEAISNLETGILIDNPRDVREAASALRLLIENPEMRKRYSKNARNRVMTNFSYRKLSYDLEQYLSQLVK